MSEYTGSRWYMFNEFIDEIAKTLSPIARDVWMVIFRHANQNGQAFITRKRIAETLSVSVVHVSHGIKILKDAGLIGVNESKYGYRLLTQTVNDSLRPNSKQEFTQQETIVYPTVNNSLPDSKQEFTHYRTFLQNTLQNTSTEPPIVPQKKKPTKKTEKKQKPLWQRQAEKTRFWEWWGVYPKHRRFDPKATFTEWRKLFGETPEEERAELEEQIIAHTKAGINSPDWTKDNGDYVPNAEKYILKRHYLREFRRPVDKNGLPITICQDIAELGW